MYAHLYYSLMKDSLLLIMRPKNSYKTSLSRSVNNDLYSSYTMLMREATLLMVMVMVLIVMMLEGREKENGRGRGVPEFRLGKNDSEPLTKDCLRAI